MKNLRSKRRFIQKNLNIVVFDLFVLKGEKMSTIVAISTAVGNSGIGIIRMSGEDTFNIIEKIFKSKTKIVDIKPNTINYGHIVSEGEIIDEVLVSFYMAPKSFTRENMCEINSHGGTIVMNKILELCLKNGAELAEPGEFTKRAFLNGRIDLSQAEAIIDIINAKSEKEAKASMKQLNGYLSEKLKNIKQKIMEVLVDIEASIDYPEYDIEEVTESRVKSAMENIEEELNNLILTFDNGKLIKEGLKVAIIGKPNAGKSSLLNAILNEERAIVTEIEGTTRDTIEEFIQVDGIPIKIIDTAGIRETNNKVEQIGISKSKEIAHEADLVIVILDASRELEKEDREILELIKEKKSIILLNKIDLEMKISKKEIEEKSNEKKILEISARNKTGIEDIFKAISDMYKFNEIEIDDSLTITNTRHKQAINNMLVNVKKVEESIENNMPIDVVTISITDILSEMGKITGESVSEDIINEIFKKFCLGK